MTDLKISQFTDGGLVGTADEIAAVRSGSNVKVRFGSAASADIGTDGSDVSDNDAIDAKITDALQNYFIPDGSYGDISVSSGDLLINAGAVGTNEVADGFLSADTAGRAKMASNFIQTGHVGNSQITYAKIQNVSATDKILGRSTAGAGVIEEITCTAFGRSLIDDADGATARTTLGFGTSVLAAQTDKNSSTSLSGILPLNLEVGTHQFSVVLFTTAAAAGGIQAGMQMQTGVASENIFNVWLYTGATVSAAGRVETVGSSTIGATAAVTCVVIEGTVVVTTAGTYRVVWAQNAASGTSSILKNSRLSVQKV